MKILQVSTFDVAGGAEQVAMNLHQGFRACGHDAWLAVGHRRSAVPGVLEIENERHRNPLARLGSRVASATRYAEPRPLGRAAADGALWLTDPARMLAIVRGREDFAWPGTRSLLELPQGLPDVLHCHNLHGEYFDLRELAVFGQQVPSFLTLHDMWSFTGHCAYSFGCERWRTGCGGCPDLSIYPPVRRDATAFNLRRKRKVYAASKLYVAAPSRWLLDKAKASVLAAGAVEWRLIPYGVDLRTFRAGERFEARSRLYLPTRGPILLYAAHAGRANPFKDYEAVSAAISRLLASDVARDLTVLVVGGEGDPHTEGRFHFVPYVKERETLADYYRAADLYVHAAREDNFPNTVLEALACGTTVVATAVGGIAEQVEDRVTGRLVSPADSAGMADAIEQLLSHPVELAAFGQRAADSAKRRFDLSRHVRDYLAWFEDALAGRRDAARSAPGRPRG